MNEPRYIARATRIYDTVANASIGPSCFHSDAEVQAFIDWTRKPENTSLDTLKNKPSTLDSLVRVWLYHHREEEREELPPNFTVEIGVVETVVGGPSREHDTETLHGQWWGNDPEAGGAAEHCTSEDDAYEALQRIRQDLGCEPVKTRSEAVECAVRLIERARKVLAPFEFPAGSLRLDRRLARLRQLLGTWRGPECGHSVCRQHFIDTGVPACVWTST